MGRKNCLARPIRVSFAPLSRCALAFVSGFRECLAQNLTAGQPVAFPRHVKKTYLTKWATTRVLTNVYKGFVFKKNLARADDQIWPSLLKCAHEDAMSR